MNVNYDIVEFEIIQQHYTSRFK